MDGTLAGSLYKATAARTGAAEHLQVAGLLKEARRISVDREAASAIRDWVDSNPWAVEANLDAIAVPEGPLWLEWPLPTRAGHGGGEAARTGCLVAPNPEHQGLLAFVTGWDTGDGQGRHAFGVAVADLQGLYDLAWNARTRFSKAPAESLARMMSSVSASMPEGFADEIDILTEGSTEAREGILRDATSEMPMVLALLVAMGRPGGLALSAAESGEAATLSPAPGPGRLERLANLLFRRERPPFIRKVRKGKIVGLDIRL